ncbi:MAG: hypothetical protein GX951_04845 [Mollicutes bacterium]|nr:hypothetical protein [Mollicutes bacterium]
MKIDILNLKQKLSLLKVMRDKMPDGKEKDVILIDIEKIEEILQYIKGENFTREHHILEEYCEKHSDFKTDQFIQENSKNIYMELYNLYDKDLPIKFCFNRKFKEDEYFAIIESFLRYINPEMLSIFHSMIQDKQIEINEKLSLNAEGYCYKLLSDDTCYILSAYNNKMSKATNLPYELAHAYQAGKFHGLDDMLKYYNSYFKESYPIFIEYTFGEFLRPRGYDRDILKIESNIIYNLIARITYAFDRVSSPEEFIIDGQFKKITSLLLAMYLINEYKKSKFNGLQIAKDMNDLLFQNRQFEIFKQIGLENLLNSGMTAVVNYKRSVRSKK